MENNIITQNTNREMSQKELGQNIFKHRLKDSVFINKPLVLISQVQRSGGSLLSQLLDGHSQLYVHPSELRIGYPTKDKYPCIDSNMEPEDIFSNLSEEKVIKLHANNGYSKYSPGADNLSELPTHPFIFSLELQRQIFLDMFQKIKPQSRREIFDCYMTSYFNAWIDYQGLYRDITSIKYCVAFVARMAVNERNIDEFFKDYPTGKFITIVREPISWYASAKKHLPATYGNLSSAIELWISSARSSMNLVKKYPENSMLLIFEELIGCQEITIRKMVNFLGIFYSDSLLKPTFNGRSILPNTSFTAEKYGINKESIDRKAYVAEHEQEEIINRCYTEYRKAIDIYKIEKYL